MDICVKCWGCYRVLLLRSSNEVLDVNVEWYKFLNAV